MSVKKLNLHCDFIYVPYMKFLLCMMISYNFLDDNL